MRVPCPKCQTVLQLAEAPPAGVKIQCGQCGAQFGVQVQRPVAVKPVVIPRPGAARPLPVAVTEIPEALEHREEGGGAGDEPGLSPRKKKKKKKLKKSSRGSGTGVKLAAAVVIALVAFGVVFFVVYNWVGSRLTPVEFNNQMVAILQKMSETAQGGAGGQGNGWMNPGMRQDPAQAMEQVDKVAGVVSTALRDVRGLKPPSDGVDFHNAAVAMLERLEKFLKTDAKQLFTLMTAGRQAEAMQMAFAAINDLQRLEGTLITAQHEFAKKHGGPLMRKMGQ